MRRVSSIFILALAFAAVAFVLAACGNNSPYGRQVDKGTFANGIPDGHHPYYSQYRWYVNVDPEDENWEFYTDQEPWFEQDGRTLCLSNALEVLHRGETDRVRAGQLCIAGHGGTGEGKVRIVEQTDPTQPANEDR